MLALFFELRGEVFAIPARAVVEVVPKVELRVVPRAPQWLAGVFPYRGAVLPVVDLTRLVGTPMEGAFRRAVLLRTPKGAVALTATKVLGVATLEGSFDPLGESGVQQHLRGPARAPAGEVAVIDTQTFVDFLAQG